MNRTKEQLKHSAKILKKYVLVSAITYFILAETTDFKKAIKAIKYVKLAYQLIKIINLVHVYYQK